MPYEFVAKNGLISRADAQVTGTLSATNKIIAGTGSAAEPSITFATATTTGFYRGSGTTIIASSVGTASLHIGRNISMGQFPSNNIGFTQVHEIEDTSGGATYGYQLSPRTAGTNVIQSHGLYVLNRVSGSISASNSYGIRIIDPTKMGAATITNNYQLYIANPTAGSSNNYAIYVESGSSHTGGTFHVNGTFSTSGSVRLGVRGGTTQFGDNCAEKELYWNFPGAANEKIDLHFSGSLFGLLQVSVIGGYYGGETIGALTKEYQFGGNGYVTTIYHQETKTSEVSQTIAAHIALGDIEWDAANSRWRIQIVHRSTAQNHYIVRARVLAAFHPGTMEAMGSMGLSSVYTTDTTSFPAPTYTFPTVTHFQGALAATGSSKFSGSVDIESGNFRIAPGTVNDIVFSGGSFPLMQFRSGSSAFSQIVSVPSVKGLYQDFGVLRWRTTLSDDNSTILYATSSYISASVPITASRFHGTASYALEGISSSFAVSAGSATTAATASSLTNFNRNQFIFTTGNTLLGTTNTYTPDGGIGANNLTRSMFFRDNAETFGTLGIHVQHTSAINYALQIVASSYGSGSEELMFRTLFNGTWDAPRTILSSKGFRTYAPDLTGSGASGNWSITASRAISSSYALTASYVEGATPVFTGKTDNYLPKWSSNTLTGTSNIYDTGTNVGIGTTNPVTKLHVWGSVSGSFSGSLLGTSSISTNVSITTNSNNTNYPLTFVASSGVNLLQIDSSTGLYYNPGTDTLTTSFFTSSNQYVAPSTSRGIYVYGDGVYIQVGPDATGRAAAIGSKTYNDFGGGGVNLNYAAYFAYDCYFDDTSATWKPIRTNLGRKWKQEMSYHSSSIKWSTGEISASVIVWTDLMSLGLDGNLGLGTMTPTDKFQARGRVASTPDGTYGIYLSGSSGARGGTIGTKAGADWNDVITLDASGRVGIGTTNPQADFQIGGSSTHRRLWINSGTSALNSSSIMMGPATRDWLLVAEQNAPAAGAAYHFRFDYTGTNAPLSNILFLNASGEVGINTSIPLTKFHVDTGGSAVSTVGFLTYNSVNAGTLTVNTIAQTRATAMIGCNWTDNNGNTAGLLNCFNNGGSKFYVGASGYVGIGTTGGQALHSCSLAVAGPIYAGTSTNAYSSSVSIGASNTDYGAVGFGFRFTTTNGTYTYLRPDTATQVYFGAGAVKIRTAPIGVSGATITFTDTMTVSQSLVTVVGGINASGGFTGSFLGTSSVASIVVISNSSANNNYYIPFVGASGNASLFVDGGNNLYYNPSTDILTVPNVSGATLTLTGNANVGGTLTAAVKSFLIKHPTKEGKKLQYGSVESPYHGVQLSGRAKIIKGEARIDLPDYIRALVKEDGVNIQVTNIRHGKTIFVNDINLSENYFTVATEKKHRGEFEFFWMLTAVRKDVPDLVTEF